MRLNLMMALVVIQQLNFFMDCVAELERYKPVDSHIFSRSHILFADYTEATQSSRSDACANITFQIC